jgi:hypothetical protein
VQTAPEPKELIHAACEGPMSGVAVAALGNALWGVFDASITKQNASPKAGILGTSLRWRTSHELIAISIEGFMITTRSSVLNTLSGGGGNRTRPSGYESSQVREPEFPSSWENV